MYGGEWDICDMLLGSNDVSKVGEPAVPRKKNINYDWFRWTKLWDYDNVIFIKKNNSQQNVNANNKFISSKLWER